MIGIDGMLAVEKLHITHKNSLAIGTKREVMYYKESIKAFYALYIVHDVDVGWERSEPIVQQKTPTSKSWLGRTHMKHPFEFDGTVTGSV